MWKAGDHLTHRWNPELGLGRVVAVEGRAVAVEFPRDGTRLRLARDSPALVPVDLGPGRRVRVSPGREEAVVAASLPDGRIRLTDGRELRSADLWPLDLEGGLFERLARGEFDSSADFANRLAALRLLELREASGLGSFLGGRIRLYPHQLHVAERATRQDPVRWLLSDEVGMGKTIEACLILNRLVRTGRVERCLVVAPDTLTVQWLGELWRKYHQVFTLLDEDRLGDVARDFGADFNPFDVHRRTVVSLEALVARPRLTDQAVAAGIDLLVVDEAQRLRRRPGHVGDPSWRAVAPIAALGRHVLLLSATPLEDDAHGFFRLLQLLRPEEFPEGTSFEERLASGDPLPACTSSTRRADIGGLPPRQAVAIDVEEAPGSRSRQELLGLLRSAPAPHVLARRQKADRVVRALASGAALSAVLSSDEKDLRAKAAEADARDPRLAWLVARGREWKQAGEKTLVFVAHRETLEWLRAALSHQGQLASGVFHEELTPARRDLEVAAFRRPEGPSLLVSTECGGEGRNFEFCTRLVLFDLPWNPVAVEQRIGRLDRIGRRIPVEIAYFNPASGIGADVVRLYEAIGLFREPIVGLEPQLAGVLEALRATAIDPEATLSAERTEALLREAQTARTRIREAAYQELHRERYRAEMADAILARVPGNLDALNEQVVTAACARLGFGVERQRGRRRFSIDFGNEALVDSLPGVPGGSSFLGTFDREEAVEDETLDFFAAGHPLVEAILGHLEESPKGRVASLPLPGAGPGRGLAAIYKDGPSFEVVVLDDEGRPRPDWAVLLRDAPIPASPPPRIASDDPEEDEWIQWVAGLFDAARKPVAVAVVVG
ncbi:MAG TPA: helicase-related protein, partial [Vicinamibacteria bacterium]